MIVNFTGITVSVADIFVGKASGDRGKLFENDDYTVTGGSQITLTSSFSAGTKLIAASSELVVRDEVSQAYEFATKQLMKDSLTVFPVGKVLNVADILAEYVVTTGASPDVGSPDLTTGLYAKLQEVARNPLHYDVTNDNVDTTATLIAFRDLVAADPSKKVIFPTGDYSYTESPNWAIGKSCIEFEGDVWFKKVGPGTGIVFDSGATGLTFDFRFGWGNRVNVDGDADSFGGVFVRSCHHCKIAVNVRGCGALFDAFSLEFSVLGEYDFVASTNQPDTFTTQPLRGLYATSRNAGETVSACTFYNIIIEGVSSNGIVLDDAIKNLFLCGTTEGNGGDNLVCLPASRINTFQGIDLEVSGSGVGLRDGGRNNTFNDLFNDAETIFESTAINPKIIGGQYDGITINAGASGTSLTDFSYGSVSGVIVDNGDFTTIRNPYYLLGARFFPNNKTLGVNDFIVTVDHPFAWVVPAAVPGFSTRTAIPIVGVKVGDNITAAPKTTPAAGFILSPSVVCSVDGQVDVTFTQISGVAVSPLPVGSEFVFSIRGA